jgi:hypothetical protein
MFHIRGGNVGLAGRSRTPHLERLVIPETLDSMLLRVKSVGSHRWIPLHFLIN